MGLKKEHYEQEQIHRPLVQHLRLRGALGLVYWHSPQGAYYGIGKSARTRGAIMSGLGVRAGVSDLVFLHQGKFYALELKSPGKTPDPDQVAFLASIVEAGGHAEYVDNLDDALATLEGWGLLRGAASR
jgi:hypothetical protein